MKDAEEEVRELTVEEKKKFERHIENYSTSFKYEPIKEKAVKINVKSVKQVNVEDNVEKVENEVKEIEKGVEELEVKDKDD